MIALSWLIRTPTESSKSSNKEVGQKPPRVWGGFFVKEMPRGNFFWISALQIASLGHVIAGLSLITTRVGMLTDRYTVR
jgi:hypothetical protein